MSNQPKIIISTAYLPSIQYFSYLMAADEVWIEQYETYPKQTFRNRCEIYSANGKLALTIPVVKVDGNHTKTRDIIISNHQNWQTMHWRAIDAAYANSPFFLYYKDDLEPFFHRPYKNLLDMNHQLLIALLEILHIKKTIPYTTEFVKSPVGVLDLRNEISPKVKTKYVFKPYYQVFEEKFGFIPGLSMLDLLFNVGDEAVDYLV
nr:WbqC family protein [Bacteroidota bacterium]